MEIPATCDKCGGTNTEAGNMGSMHPVAFVPQTARWFHSVLGVNGILCLDCGAISTFANPVDLQRHIQRRENSS